MIPLFKFIAKSGASELTISPVVKGEPLVSSISALPFEDWYCEIDTNWQPNSRYDPLLCFDDDESSWQYCEPLRLLENIDYEVVIILPMTHSQFLNMAKDHGSEYPFANERIRQSVTISRREGITELAGNKVRILAHLRFDNAVGAADLSLHPSVSNFSLSVEVTSSKLDYGSDFPLLLDSLSEMHAEVMLSLDAATEIRVNADPKSAPTLQSILWTLRWALQEDRIPLSLATIVGNPLVRIRSISGLEQASFAVSPDYVGLLTNPEQCEWIKLGNLARYFCGFTPSTLPCKEVEFTYDSVENRFVKYALRQIIDVAKNVFAKLPSKPGASKRWLEKRIELLEEVSVHTLWDKVGECREYPASMVIYQRPGYRDFFQCFTIIGSAIGKSHDPTTSELSGDVKAIWKLYELWCYFQLYKVMVTVSGGCVGEPKLSSLIDAKLWDVDMKEGINAGVTFRWSCNGTSVSAVLYNSKSSSKILPNEDKWSESYTSKYHPDYSIKIEIKGISHWLHFDAKYRVSSDQRKSHTELDGTGDPNDIVRWVKAEDLSVAHQYRDALLGTRGCYVLYPGNTEHGTLFVRHGLSSYRQANLIPSVGAFPLCPNKLLLDKQCLRLESHLRKVVEQLASANAYQEEFGLS